MQYFIILCTLILLFSGCSTTTNKNAPSLLKQPIPPAELSEEIIEHITISAVGDIFMGGTSTPVMKKMGYHHPFAKTKLFLSSADVSIGNLEGPLTSQGTANRDKKYVFRTPANKVAPALKNAGFDVVTLANNHTLDYGVVGLNDTIQALQQHHIAYIGAGNNLKEARKPYIFEKSGYKVGFLGYSLTYPESFWAKANQAGTVFGYAHTIRQDLQQLREHVDSIVVSFHWGREGKTTLRDYQTRLGRLAIDEGATLVIGHHPHIMQGIEAYKNGLILYSLGNYVFGSYSNRSQFGGIAKVTLNRQGFASLTLHPIDTNNFRRHFQPDFLHGKRLHQALSSVQQLSLAQQTQLHIKNNTLVLKRNETSSAKRPAP